MNNIWKDLGLEVGKIIADEIKGGPTSGNYGHGGRPGERGGSTPGGGHVKWYRWVYSICTKTMESLPQKTLTIFSLSITQ